MIIAFARAATPVVRAFFDIAICTPLKVVLRVPSVESCAHEAFTCDLYQS
jgi:hypothetical protein